ncbi:hypothetical protein CTI12_AA032830 [Artemisia annua]|uniref:Uncharacterized protein n=1 Tax=Artemisia annua TaxID=35608 RepID=A0A2U1QGF7_ARTAN|nr:hypothetical protein CTI12_AA032830 [Artemisia annua]
MTAKKNKQIIQMENVDVELGGKVDVVQNTVQSLLDCVQNVDVELGGEVYVTNKFSPSIYMAPRNLRDLSPNSFDPRVVSIGPLHREDENVQAFEGRKSNYIHDLLKRIKSPREKTLEACVQKVAASIKQIKGCYAGIKAYDDTEFAKMMVMDACFILEFIYWYSEPEKKTQLNKLLAQSIIYDLVLLENQIPFFVLNDIFLCTIKKFEPDNSLIEFICPVLKFLNLFEANIKISNIRIDATTHILGLLHQCYQPRSKTLSYFSSSTIHSAVELDRAGVNFKPNRDKKWPMAMEVKLHLHRFLCFPWSWGKPTIRMPVLRVHHFTELVLRNIIAYEQSSLGDNYVTSYGIAMDRLIDTQEDVAKLVESKVLVNNMGSNEEAANMMNSICKEVAWVHRGPDKHGKKLDTYCKDYWPKNIARLRRTYFSNPWSIIALIAGMVLFALTVIQTFFTIRPPGN